MTWKKIILIILASFVISFASYYFFNRFWGGGNRPPAALHVESLGKPLTVVLDNNVLGKTPFHSESLKESVSSLVLSSEESSLRTKISLISGVLTVVNWDVGPAEIFSSGEIVWLEKSKSGVSLVVFGSPEEAEVRLDEEFLGATPVSTDKVTVGDHTVRVSKPGFESRSIKVNIQEGYKLSIKFQLFLVPAAADLPLILFPQETRLTLRDFSANDPLLYSDTKTWVRGLVYSFGKDNSNGGNQKQIDYFVDFTGQFFDQNGFKLPDNLEVKGQEKLILGYLGRKSDGGLTEEARSALAEFAKRALISQKLVQILSTSTGWLRVRSAPSLSGEEVAKVNVGEKVVFLDEEGSWYQIKLSDGKTGWISAAFAKKL